MVNFNQVIIVGNLTKDPELRYTPSGTAVTTLRMAINSPFKDKAGQLQKETCFINVVVWAQAAEACNQYLTKGSSAFVDGRLVRANRVQFMSKGTGQEGKIVESNNNLEEISNISDGGELGEVL